MSFYIFVSSYINNVVSSYINFIEFLLGTFPDKKSVRALDLPLGETLLKIESAHKHLTDVIEGIDIIRDQVMTEKTQLDRLIAEVEQKKTQYNEAANDLETTQQLLSKDQEKLRTVLGVDSSREKIIGFTSGVIASVIATAIWVLGVKIMAVFNNSLVSKCLKCHERRSLRSDAYGDVSRNSI